MRRPGRPDARRREQLRAATLAARPPVTYGGHTYYLLDKQTWLDAEAEAVSLGGHLVAINDSAENDFILNSFAEDHIWIGFTDRDLEGSLLVVDIKPGSFPNPVNPRAKGVIPVAILTTTTADGEAVDFDATTVDPLSLRFGPGDAPEAHAVGHLEDVDGDGDLDLLAHFDTPQARISCGETSASLTGMTYAGGGVEGSDSIVTTGCH